MTHIPNSGNIADAMLRDAHENMSEARHIATEWMASNGVSLSNTAVNDLARRIHSHAFCAVAEAVRKTIRETAWTDTHIEGV